MGKAQEELGNNAGGVFGGRSTTQHRPCGENGRVDFSLAKLLPRDGLSGQSVKISGELGKGLVVGGWRNVSRAGENVHREGWLQSKQQVLG